MGSQIIPLLIGHLTEIGINHRFYGSTITILDAAGVGRYQLRLESKDDSDLLIHAVEVMKPRPKSFINGGGSDILYVPRKHKIFKVGLFDSGSIAKIDEWLSEIRSKLK